MKLNNIHIENCRMIATADMTLSSGINLIIGKNGAGKSSLIEAFSILSTGRSFRTRRISEVIRWDCTTLLITANIFSSGSTSHIGIEKKQGETRIRIDQRDIRSQAELSQHLPVTTITPDSIGLIMGSPSVRRRYLDWIGFYLLPNFHQVWKHHQRILKQRNACLRNNQLTTDFNYWTKELISIQATLYEKRHAILALLETRVNTFRKKLLPDKHVSLSLSNGFPSIDTFENGNNLAFYQSKLSQELKLKRTLYGLHKSDLKIYINDSPAHIAASRGELKLLSILLYLAQSDVLTKRGVTSGIIIIDDVISELDKKNQLILFQALQSLKQQIILTAPIKSKIWKGNNIKMFHVKHGEVSEVS
ncbi:MAG: DNA replication/repair protein RecF [Cocleimonas sp.]|nr:DNA replication/repair protein RecF [Cocleimonas sp.]